MRKLHETMKVVLGTLQVCDLKGIVINTKKLFEWKFVPFLVLYCCSTPGSKELPIVRCNDVVKSSCITYMLTGEDIVTNLIVQERSVRVIALVRQSLLEFSSNNIASVFDETEGSQKEEK